MKAIRLLTLLLALLLLAAPAFAEAPTSAQVGREAPDFELTQLNGEVFRLSEHRGEVVLLNVWATWCPPCVGEMPDIQSLSEAYDGELTVIGVSVDDDPAVVEDFIAENGYTYRFAMDTADWLVAGQLYPTAGIPESVFIDKDGIVKRIVIGAFRDYATLEEAYLSARGE